MIKLLGQLAIKNLKIVALVAKLSIKTVQIRVLNTVIRKKNK